MKHFLIIDGKEYRSEVNMRTAENWERLSGMKIGQFELEAATSAKNGGVATRLMVYWLYCSLVEGEELEGRDFPYSLEELRKVVRPSILTEFAPVFLMCYIGESAIPGKKEKVQKKSTRRLGSPIFYRWLWVVCFGLLIFSIAAVLHIYLRH